MSEVSLAIGVLRLPVIESRLDGSMSVQVTGSEKAREQNSREAGRELRELGGRVSDKVHGSEVDVTVPEHVSNRAQKRTREHTH